LWEPVTILQSNKYLGRHQVLREDHLGPAWTRVGMSNLRLLDEGSVWFASMLRNRGHTGMAGRICKCKAKSFEATLRKE
jgi:hypothetical protein